MRIVNPAFGHPAEGDVAASDGERVAGPPVDWRHDPIVLFSNSKPNARELLEGVRAHVGAFAANDEVGFVYKDSASQPAPAALYDEIAQKYRGALLAIAD